MNSAAKIVTSMIIDFKRKDEDRLGLLLVPSISLYPRSLRSFWSPELQLILSEESSLLPEYLSLLFIELIDADDSISSPS